jgi:hypothetical protein
VGRSAAALADGGFSYVVVSWPTEGWDRVREFASDVMPELAGL